MYGRSGGTLSESDISVSVWEDLAACVCVGGEKRMSGSRDQYDFESNNITVIPAVCLQQSQS